MVDLAIEFTVIVVTAIIIIITIISITRSLIIMHPNFNLSIINLLKFEQNFQLFWQNHTILFQMFSANLLLN